MEQSEKTFWGIAVIAGLYVFASFSFHLETKANAQQPSSPPQVVTQPAAQGMGCMARAGGGCGCGGMMRKQ